MPRTVVRIQSSEQIMAGKVDHMEVGMAAMKTFANPGIDIVKSLPEGIVELILRGVAIVLALINLIAAAVCQGAINRSVLRDTGAVPDVQTFDTAAWIIFLSFWVILYQILAIIQLFLRIEVLYITVPVIDWSIFFLVDIIAIGIAAAGYFCGAVPLVVYADRWDNFNGDSTLGSAFVASSAAATSVFSFIAMILFIGMIVYFFVAQIVLKWSTHSEHTETELPPPPLDSYRPAPE